MKILITGGAGFIGSALVRTAIAKGHEVINLDALTYAACLDNVAEVADHPNYHFEHADITDAVALRRIFETHKPDVVMNLAAESHVDRSIDAPESFIRTNINGTYEMLAAGRRFWQDAGQPSCVSVSSYLY